MMNRRALPRCFPAVLTVLLLSSAASAHQFNMTAAKITLAEGRFRVEFRCDLDALALGLPGDKMTDDDHRYLRSLSPDEQHLSELQLRCLLDKRLWIRFDGGTAQMEASFPEKGTLSAEGNNAPPFYGHVAAMTGDIPAGSQNVSFQASRAFGVVVLTVEGSGGILVERTLAPGSACDPISLTAPTTTTPRWTIALQYLWLGFEHILPKGFDHILFVLSLYLLSAQLAPLLWQVTAFTVAHSVTLALSMYGVVSLPLSIVEPLIAVSIAVVAIENMLTTKLQPWRPFVVFAFGLLHGLGFAGVLTELGLPRDRYVTALISFNGGVELGQLAVILLALIATAWCRKRNWYHSRIVVPTSLAIASIGLYWAVQRTFG